MTDDQTAYNAGDAQQVDSAKKKRKVRELRKQAALKAILGTTDGRLWMWELLQQCDVLAPVMPIAGGSDGMAMALNTHFRLGKYSIGMMLIAEINRLDPEFYARMSVENTKKSE
jgi:hypothetical protein